MQARKKLIKAFLILEYARPRPVSMERSHHQQARLTEKNEGKSNQIMKSKGRNRINQIIDLVMVIDYLLNQS